MFRTLWRLVCLAFLVTGVSRGLPLSAADPDPARQWGQWRGPLATGVSPYGDPPIEWSEDKNVRWASRLPGTGHSTPVVWGQLVFVTAAVPFGEKVTAKPDADPGAHDNLPVTQPHRYLGLAYERRTGELLWLYCIGFDGKLLWKVRMGKMATKHNHGEGASPALYDKTLVVNWDHQGQSKVVAFDTRTGKSKWSVDRDEVTSWSSPIVIKHQERAVVVISGTKFLRGYDLENGKVLWQCAGLSNNIVATPVYEAGMVFAGSSYDTRIMMGVNLDGASGDLTGSEHIAWKTRQRTPYVPSPLLYKGGLYFLRHYQGILTRLEARTGNEVTGPFRLGGVTDIYASPVAAANRIYITDRQGATLVISGDATPKFLARNVLNDSFSASAAIVGRELFLRGTRKLYCIAGPAKPKKKRGD